MVELQSGEALSAAAQADLLFEVKKTSPKGEGKREKLKTKVFTRRNCRSCHLQETVHQQDH